MAPKILIDTNKIFLDSFLLARIILDSGFRPNVMYGVIRGGSLTANVINEVFTSIGIESKFAATITKSYTGQNQDDAKIVKIGGYTLMPNQIKPHSKVLLIEDLVDSGHSVGSVMADLLDQNPNLSREDIKVAVLYWKHLHYRGMPKNVRFRRLYLPDRQHIYEMPNPYSSPDFWVEKLELQSKDENPWISQPHEIIGDSDQDIESKMGTRIAAVVHDIKNRYGADG